MRFYNLFVRLPGEATQYDLVLCDVSMEAIEHYIKDNPRLIVEQDRVMITPTEIEYTMYSNVSYGLNGKGTVVLIVDEDWEEYSDE